MKSAVVLQHYHNAKLKSDKENEKNFQASCKYCANRTICGNV